MIRASLKLAMQRGWWRGDLDAVIPADFDPVYVAKERDFKRQEFEALIPKLGEDSAAAAAFIVATGAEDAALHRALLVAPNVLSVAHWNRLGEGQLYAAQPRVDWAIGPLSCAGHSTST